MATFWARLLISDMLMRCLLVLVISVGLSIMVTVSVLVRRERAVEWRV